jgi:hypothetical protein
MEGSWEVDNGPRQQPEELVRTINAQTREMLGASLFKNPSTDALLYPAAQNDHRYQDAHRDLYGYLIDGLELLCIKLLAERSGCQLDPKATKTVRALRSTGILSDSADIWALFEHVSAQRGKATHGSRSPAKQFAAFEQFENDLQRCVAALGELSTTLAKLFHMDASVALRRDEARAWLPRISRPPESHYSVCRLSDAVGKTIVRVEYGFGDRSGAHESEVMILHFSDGSVLGIETGCNAGNLCSEQNGLKVTDFHASFVLQWVPMTGPVVGD